MSLYFDLHKKSLNYIKEPNYGRNSIFDNKVSRRGETSKHKRLHTINDNDGVIDDNRYNSRNARNVKHSLVIKPNF